MQNWKNVLKIGKLSTWKYIFYFQKPLDNLQIIQESNNKILFLFCNLKDACFIIMNPTLTNISTSLQFELNDRLMKQSNNVVFARYSEFLCLIIYVDLFYQTIQGNLMKKSARNKVILEQTQLVLEIKQEGNKIIEQRVVFPSRFNKKSVFRKLLEINILQLAKYCICMNNQNSDENQQKQMEENNFQSNNLDKSSDKMSTQPIQEDSTEMDLTIRKNNKNKKQYQSSSETTLLESYKQDASFESYNDGSIYQKQYDITSSYQSKGEELDDIGKISSSKANNDLYHFKTNSISQHRILTKSIKKMKTQFSLNVQLNKLDQKKQSENNDDDCCDDDNDADDDDQDGENDDYDDNSDENNKNKKYNNEGSIEDNNKKQKSWKRKLANDYLILEILGNGGQGKVATFLDKNNNNIIALKEFSRMNQFERECKIYSYLQEQTDLHEYVNLMLNEDRSQRQIKLQMGSCNLYEMYIQMKNLNNSGKNNKIKWEQDHLIKIFRQLIHGLIAFRRKKFFHGDIKPHNLMLFSVESIFNHYIVKYIDLGAAGFKAKDYYEFYSDQFYHPEFLDQVVTKEYVLTDEEITTCEIYAIIRSIWIINCFEKEELTNFKENTDIKYGIKFLSDQFPRLSELLFSVYFCNGDLEKIEQIIQNDQINDQQILSFSNLSLFESQKYDDQNKKSSQVDINANYLKLNDQMKELIQKIIQMKKEKFINEQSEDQLQELFEIFYSLGQDQRALEIFHELEISYEKLFKKYLSPEGGEIQKKFNLRDEEVYQKIKVIKESIILLNEKGELERAIQWNKRLLNLFTSGKFINEKEAILQSIQFSILLNTKGEIVQSLQMAKEARNNYKSLIWQQANSDKALFQKQIYSDTIYGYICQVIGRLYVEINSFSNGLKYLSQALQIFKEVKKQNEEETNQNEYTEKESEIEGEDLNNMIQLTLIKLSQASQFLRHNNRALEFIDQAITLGQQMYGKRVNKQQAACLNIKSHILKQQGQELDALELQKKCLDIRLKIHNQVDHRFISNSLNSISLLESKLGDHNQALQNQEQCYQMRLRLYQKENPNHHQIVACLRNFGFIYQKMGEFQKSEEYLLQAYNMTLKSNDLFQRINSLKTLEQLYKLTHQSDKYKHYQQLRIQAKQELLDTKKNLHFKKTESVSDNVEGSSRKLSNYSELYGSPILQSQSHDDESITQSSNKKKGKKPSNQPQIDLTTSYPITIQNTQQNTTQNKKVNQNANKNKRNSLLKNITSSPGQNMSTSSITCSTQSLTDSLGINTQSSNSNIQNANEKSNDEKQKPNYKKRSRGSRASQFQQEIIPEEKDEDKNSVNFFQVNDTQPLKDEIKEKKNYKKNGRRTSKRKSIKQKSQNDLDGNHDEQLTITTNADSKDEEFTQAQDNIKAKKVANRLKQLTESNNDDDQEKPQKLSFQQKAKAKFNNMIDTETKRSQDEQKFITNNQRPQINKGNKGPNVDSNFDRKQSNKNKVPQKNQGQKQNKVMKEGVERDFIEAVDKADKQQQSQENIKNPPLLNNMTSPIKENI